MSDIVDELKMLAMAAIDPRVKMTANSAIEEIERLRAERQWQPIETAPDAKEEIKRLCNQISSIESKNRELKTYRDAEVKRLHEEIERLRTQVDDQQRLINQISALPKPPGEE